MPVSDSEKYLQDQCRALKKNCKDLEEARYFLPEIVKKAQRLFYQEHYEIPGYAEDILKEEFDDVL